MANTLNTFQEENNAEPAEHTAAMLAKAEQIEANNRGEERPEWLPEKFKSVEDMAKAYGELEKKLSSPSSEETGENTETTEVKEETTEVAEADASEVAETLSKAGVDFDSLQSQYTEKGELDEASYKKLEEAGFPKTLVDSWIAGQQALVSDIHQQVYGSVGGVDNYNQMLEWAGDNLPPAEIEAFNKAVDSDDINMVNFAVNGLSARYRSEVGTEPKLVQGETAGTSGGSYQSAAELTAAMRDPRYQSDPAYRRAVSEKLSRSNVF